MVVSNGFRVLLTCWALATPAFSAVTIQKMWSLGTATKVSFIPGDGADWITSGCTGGGGQECAPGEAETTLQAPGTSDLALFTDFNMEKIFLGADLSPKITDIDVTFIGQTFNLSGATTSTVVLELAGINGTTINVMNANGGDPWYVSPGNSSGSAVISRAGPKEYWLSDGEMEVSRIEASTFGFAVKLGTQSGAGLRRITSTIIVIAYDCVKATCTGNYSGRCEAILDDFCDDMIDCSRAPGCPGAVPNTTTGASMNTTATTTATQTTGVKPTTGAATTGSRTTAATTQAQTTTAAITTAKSSPTTGNESTTKEGTTGEKKFVSPKPKALISAALSLHNAVPTLTVFAFACLLMFS